MTSAVIALILAATGLAEPYRVGVFDTHLTGGQGASSAGFIAVFDELPDYVAEPLDALDLPELCRYDIVILYDMHSPGRVAEGWRDNIAEYVRRGGSVLNIYHQHIFGSIGPGVLKVNVRQVRPRGQHPITEGIRPFGTAWRDHIILKPGADATVFLENARGEPVGACGSIGAGKVVNCGLALGIKRDWRDSKPPTGMERKLLVNILRWLRPQERWPARLSAVLTTPYVRATLASPYVRQPQAARLRLRALFAQAPGPVLATLQVQDRQGRQARAQRTLTAGQVPGASVWELRAEVSASTKGLASGIGQSEYRLSAAGRQWTGKEKVKLVRTRPPQREFRAFWTHAFEDRLPADIMPRIRACGFNAVIPRSSGGTAAFYLSRVLPDVKNILGQKDWLENCVEYAHRNGLKVYPYRNCFIMQGRATPETIARFRAAGRLQVDPRGQPIDWMCPSQEENRRLEVAAALELVTRYDVDGFQFDFIRYPGASGCFCPKCRDKFERQIGRRVKNWPQDVLAGGELFAEYTRFRQQQITETVRMVSSAIRQANPRAKISAAVFRDWEHDSVAVGQDWVTWAKKGYVDFLCPMDYTDDVAQLDRWVVDQVKRAGQYVPICAGLGLASARAKMKTPEDLAVQIDVARQAGARGFVLFCWYPGCDEKIVAPLRDDALAGTPPMPWD